MRRAIGDLQTGVVDSFNLTNQFTDPTTAQIFDDISVDIAKDEQRIADIYHGRIGTEEPDAATPSTGSAVSA
jgi:protease I